MTITEKNVVKFPKHARTPHRMSTAIPANWLHQRKYRSGGAEDDKLYGRYGIETVSYTHLTLPTKA